jgi:hypothetical protein
MRNAADLKYCNYVDGISEDVNQTRVIQLHISNVLTVSKKPSNGYILNLFLKILNDAFRERF